MPRNITITLEDGSTHTYQNAPDNVTPDMVQARAEKEFGKKVTALDGGTKQLAQAKPSTSLADQIPGQRELSAKEKAYPVNQPQPEAPDFKKDSTLGKVVGALYETPLTIGSSALAGLGAAWKQVLTNGTDQEAKDFAKKYSYAPATNTGAQLSAMVGKAAEPLAALPSAHLLEAGQAVGSGASSLRNLAGPAASIASNAAAPATAKLSSMAKSVVPKIEPQTAELAAQAQKFNIPLRPDMLYGNKVAKMLGEASEKVPLSGSKADARQAAFNKAIIGTIGGDETAIKLTPDVFDKAIRQSGEKIGDIAARSPLPIDEKLSGALKSHLENAAKYETSDVQKVVTSYIDELNSKAIDGVVPGEALRKINTKMTKQMRSTSNGDLKHALSGLQDDIQDAVQSTLSGSDLAELQAARRQYAIAKNIEPLVAKSTTGDISPAGLMGRMTSDNAGKSRMARGNGGDIGDLARIGQKFLKEPNSSGTAERSLAYGLAGGGIVAQPAVAGGVYGAANIYNRAGTAISNKLIKRSLSDMAGGKP